VVDTSTPDLARHQAPSSEDSGTAAPVYPLVTVCVVAHNPGAWFDEVLGSLLAQDYPSLDLVVVDAASAEPIAPRVHAIIPEATVVPLLANQGFPKNANTILDQPGLGPYLLICHDDVALAPDCIRRLVEETMRSNAGIVGPKLLDWDDPNRISHVGFGADKTGQLSELAEPGEYDQEQHDAVRDVFAVPGAVTLLRTDLFQALEGFDEGMLVQGEDLDLCWRAHALGARVLVNPSATARHREDLPSRVVGFHRTRYVRRHRIRSMLSNYGLGHTLRVVPQAIVVACLSMAWALFQGRLGAIAEIGSSWAWNLRRLGQIRDRRRRLKLIRQISDADVRSMQIAGFEQIHAFRRRRADRGEKSGLDLSDPNQRSAIADRQRWIQLAMLVWASVAVVLVFGSRDLITNGVPVFNEFPAFPDGPSPLLTEWGSTWRSTGVGAEGASSLLHAILGLGGIALFGQMGLLRLIVTVGMLVVGAVGAYRMLQPFKSIPAQVVALIVYVAAPLPYNALHGGSWSGLVAYGAMPWIARRLAIAAGVPPYGDDDTTLSRRLADTLVVAVIIAAAALVAPLVGVSIFLLGAGWLLGGLATRRVQGMARLIAVVILAAGLGFVLLMPASLAIFDDGFDWPFVGGTRSTTAGQLRLADLFRFATGPHGGTAVGWALLVLPALALVLAFGQRMAWAARSWIVIVASVGIAWIAEQGNFSVALADPHVLLAPAAMSMAFAGGMAAMAFQRDLRRYRFGWRQLVPFVAVLAVVSSAGAGLGAAVEGSWQVVDDGYEGVFSFFDEKAPAHARALWIGEADVLQVDGWRYDDRLTFALTPARTPTVLDLTRRNVDDTTEQVREVFADTLAGASSRLGQRLSLYGVRYIVVVEANAPAPFSTIERVVDPELTGRLTEQLDLVRVEVRPGATIYENRAYVPMVSFFPSDVIRKLQPGMAPANFALALPEVTSLRSYRGPTQAGDVYASMPAVTNWSLEIDGQEQERLRIFKWSQLFEAERPGTAVLKHSNETALWLGSIGQLVGWLILITGLVLGRRRRS